MLSFAAARVKFSSSQRTTKAGNKPASGSMRLSINRPLSLFPFADHGGYCLVRYRATALPRQHPTGRQPSNRERIPIGCRTSRVCDGRAERWWILSRLGRVLSQVLSGRGRLARGGCPIELQGATEDQGSRRPQRRQAKDAEYRCWYRALEEQQAGVAGCQSDD